jgi:hypothetical protein
MDLESIIVWEKNYSDILLILVKSMENNQIKHSVRLLFCKFLSQFDIHIMGVVIAPACSRIL